MIEKLKEIRDMKSKLEDEIKESGTTLEQWKSEEAKLVRRVKEALKEARIDKI